MQISVLTCAQAHGLQAGRSKQPGAAAGFTLGPDNVCFRTRLRRAHPETEDAMHRHRRAIVEVRALQHSSHLVKPA